MQKLNNLIAKLKFKANNAMFYTKSILYNIISMIGDIDYYFIFIFLASYFFISLDTQTRLLASIGLFFTINHIAKQLKDILSVIKFK